MPGENRETLAAAGPARVHAGEPAIKTRISTEGVVRAPEESVHSRSPIPRQKSE